MAASASKPAAPSAPKPAAPSSVGRGSNGNGGGSGGGGSGSQGGGGGRKEGGNNIPNHCQQFPWECAASNQPSSNPVEGMILSGYYYGQPDAGGGLHPGIEVVGSSNIITAPVGGNIYFYQSFAGQGLVGFGNHAILVASGERGNRYQLLFAHMRDNNTFGIENGAFVNQGRPIGVIGSTGNSSGNHLHYEVRRDQSFDVDAFKSDRLRGRSLYYPSERQLALFWLNPWQFPHGAFDPGPCHTVC